MLGCLGKVPPDRSQGHVTDYIIQQPEPQKVKDIQSFLDFANFYRHNNGCIPSILHPPHQALELI
jgi:hypothetical protein